jgi:hypothetical protein
MANPAPLHHTEGEKERARWEMFREDCPRGLQPGNPYRAGNEYGKAGAVFPMMLFRAERVPAGLPGAGKFATSCAEPRRFGFRDEDEWNAARAEAQRFTESCNHIVHDEDQLLKAKGQGWRESSKDAVALAESGRLDAGDITAAQNYADKNMSEKALAEKDKAVAGHFGHLPEIPAKPIVRRVKKEKAGKSASA